MKLIYMTFNDIPHTSTCIDQLFALGKITFIPILRSDCQVQLGNSLAVICVDLISAREC